MSSVYPPFGGSPVQLCLRCGKPMPSNAVTCVNCGTYNPVAQPGTFSDQSQVQYNFYSLPGKNPQSNFNDFKVAPQQNAYYSSSTTTYGGYIQSPQQKRGPRVGLIVGVVLLVVFLVGSAFMVVFLVGSAFTGYFYYKNHNQNSTAKITTPKVLVTPTAIPLFSDSFNTNNKGWDLTSNPGKFSVKVGAGSLVLEDDQNKLLWEIVPGKIFTDFRLDVDATLTRGDPNNGYGVLIRESSQGTGLGTYYRFELYGDGTYAIFKGHLDATGTTRSMKIQGYMSHPAIAKVGQVNHLTIVAKGPTMSLIVNGQAVYTYTDNNYKGGSIALFVSNLPELPPGAQATFTNLAIFPVPA